MKRACHFLPRLFSLALSFCLMSLLIVGASAHVPDEYDSVHFNSGQPDFGALPRRGLLPGEDLTREIGGRGWGDDGRLDPRKQELTPDMRELAAERRSDAFRQRARAAEARGDWANARRIYADLAAIDGWNGDLRDRVAVLGVVGNRKPAIAVNSVAGVALRHYLLAMDDFALSDGQKWTAADALFVNIATGQDGGVEAAFLRPYARYQIAAQSVAWFDYPEAIRDFQSLLHDYPHFARREEALIMLARAALLPKPPEDRVNAVGLAAIHELLADYPNTRFRAAALGLRARVDFTAGRLQPALTTYLAIGDLDSVEEVLRTLPQEERNPLYPTLLCAYLRRLDRADTHARYVAAVESVQRTIALLSPGGARVFVARLRAEPALAAPYFYYRLYHCENKPADFKSLAKLAARLASGSNPALLTPHIEVRFAEVFYQSGDNTDAMRWAQTAATHYVGSTPFDRALYVEGAVWNRTHGHAADARRTFEALLARCPTSPLRFAAHENLALADEATGDLPAALDQYFLMDYQVDVAYFLDVRMTIDQVAAYAAARPTSRVGRARHELLVYSLGIRLMRAERWAEARRCLESLPHKQYVKLWNGKNRGYEGEEESGWTFDDNQPDPLRTIDDLARLQRGVGLAHTNADRAHALFRYASYYYDHGTLLLYNASLWKGRRELAFGEWWNGGVAAPADGAAIRPYMYAHEVYARTQSLCEQIARDYPDTPTAPYALYRAGCCASKLGGFNSWWREDTRVDHWQQAANLMSRLNRRYPGCPLAKEARKFARVYQDGANQSADERRESAKQAYENTQFARNRDRDEGL